MHGVSRESTNRQTRRPAATRERDKRIGNYRHMRDKPGVLRGAGACGAGGSGTAGAGAGASSRTSAYAS